MQQTPTHVSGVRPDGLYEAISEEMEKYSQIEDEMYRQRQVYAYALVDQARLDGEGRKELDKVMEKEKLALTSMMGDPQYRNLHPYSAALVHPAGFDPAKFGSEPAWKYMRLIQPLFRFNSNIISGWLTSKLGPEALAKHFEGATYAYRMDGGAYFLSYYDPLALPLLDRLASRSWKVWFFGPLVSWWYPVDTPREERWLRVEGGRQAEASPPVKLVFSEDLWDAMASDPFPHALLDFLNKQEGLAFNSDCYGVRLAQIEMLLEEGRGKGLSENDDLGVYVSVLLESPASARDPRWQEAVRDAAGGRARLDQYFLIN